MPCKSCIQMCIFDTVRQNNHFNTEGISMILRKPFGFALIYVILSFLVTYLIMSMRVPFEYGWIAIALAQIIIFTLIYIFVVSAHLSNHFRLYASLYIAILGLVSSLIIFGINDPIMFMGALKSMETWISTVTSFVISYVGITVANWLAGFALKTKGHI